MRKFTKNMIGMFLILFCAGVFSGGTAVNAEESDADVQKYIYREASGEMEELIGIRISDDEEERLLEQQQASSIQWSGNTEEDVFLDCGSDYGYQDMAKRSNGENRQYVYREMEKTSREFTLSGEDCTVDSSTGDTYYVAATINTTGRMMSTDDVVETYFTFRNDNPQFFWLSNTILWGSRSIFVLSYDAYQDGGDRAEAFDEILQTADDVYHSKIAAGDSDYQTVKKIHDALIADIEYSSDINEETAHSIAGAMTSARSAVCEGYAKVMQLMMNYYDIPNIYVTGLGNGGSHAWNMVQMPNGKYYWLDATWDDQEDEIFWYDYFLVGNENFTDHIPDSPENTGAYFLYELPAASDTDYDPEKDEDIPEEIPDVIITGDVTGDETVNIEDLRTILRTVCGKVSLREWQRTAADVTDDGSVDIEDLRMVLRFVCRKIDSFG